MVTLVEAKMNKVFRFLKKTKYFYHYRQRKSHYQTAVIVKQIKKEIQNERESNS